MIVSDCFSLEYLDGFLLLDKPCGISSNALVQKAKRLLLAKKVGHTGTLDPLASGLMLLCFGRATKLSNQLMAASKAYSAKVILGEKRSTGDEEGVVECCSSHQPGWVDVYTSVYSLIGPIEQIPPMHSALKRNGVPLYKLARRGVLVDRPRRLVIIHGIVIHHYSYPVIDLPIFCSKGTYIRTLAEDIGSSLGSYAYLGELRRTMVGEYHVNQATSLQSLENMSLDLRRACLLPIDQLKARTLRYPPST